ncbi:MAG TPA: outer membrane beta-barrel protein [Chitinophagaceae bacterium]|nr:outer membrane beta-barrel protein [Chitinophagaceae bacterium]
MRTKLLLIVLFAFTLSKSAFSQQSRAIVKAGVNLANVSTTNDGNIDDANMLTSFQVGIVGDIHVTSLLYFQPGLVFTGKGSKIQIGRPEENLYAKQTSNPYYIEVPANLVVKLPFNSESHFFIGAGPYGAIGVAGKAKTDMTVLGFSSSTDNKIEFSNDDPSTFGQEEGTGLGVLKRFDYGVNGIIGIEGKKLVLSAGYGLGLAKLQSGSDSGEDNNNKHRVLSFTIGVKL